MASNWNWSYPVCPPPPREWTNGTVYYSQTYYPQPQSYPPPPPQPRPTQEFHPRPRTESNHALNDFFRPPPQHSNFTGGEGPRRGAGRGRKDQFYRGQTWQGQQKKRGNWEAKPRGDGNENEDQPNRGPRKGRGGGRGGNAGNWRKNGNNNKVDEKLTSACQRERLTEQLYRGTLECLVCYDRIHQAERVWSCSNCHHVLHLDCIVKWVNSSTDATAEMGWRCPACQNVTKHIPTEYRCMCGQVKNPDWVRGETPHTCGRICGRRSGCAHPCTLLCHPGPCPQCCANVQRDCGCGKTTRTVLCSSTVVVMCGNKCEKPLNCGVHLCEKTCHSGDCGKCEETLHQECFCGGESRDLECDGSVLPAIFGGPLNYSCGRPCTLKLSCSNHNCSSPCHPPPCSPCPLTPTLLTKCQCGAKPVPEGKRSSCTDPVYTCGGVCSKELRCGTNERHKCKSECHEGPCPPCDGVTSVVCRCGLVKKEVECRELTGNPNDTLCQKRCAKKRSCGKHKCNQPCCIEIEHICPMTCNKGLQCGIHRCDRLCHRGHCPPCLVASFEELHCECGKSVIHPPVPCGSRPPECRELCSRAHPCGHVPTHNCHSLPECPPCTVLTTRYCHGAHEMRKTVPCHMGEYSCGLKCGKPLPCGHKCPKPCHPLACSTTCSQPCTVPRSGCSHPCMAPCHSGPCPVTACSASLTITCECGRRTATRTCSENSSDYHRIQTSLLAAKMADVRLGKSVDATDVSAIASKLSLKSLECNDECKLYERNLRLAIGLQIANPDLSLKLNPRYSDSLKAWVRKDRRFVEMVHEKLTQLVQLAKTSKQRSRAHSFQSMGAAKRHFIHEYCDHFGVESVAYDPEPNRNIVATAFKDKCWLPSYSILEVVDRESGHRKVPSLLPSLKKEATPQESTKMITSVKPKNPPSHTATSSTEN